MESVELGILDQTPVTDGGNYVTALQHSVRLAQKAEEFGYARFWVTEHHGYHFLGCPSPDILMAAVASATQKIKVGAGGFMLKHYHATRTFEDVNTLEALYPGRIEVGFGSAPSTSPELQEVMEETDFLHDKELYRKRLARIMSFVQGETAWPTGKLLPKNFPPIYILGSTTNGASCAASYGTAFVFAHFISRKYLNEAIEIYKSEFQPSVWHKEPKFSLGVLAFCAPTDEEAQRLIKPAFWAIRRHRQRKPIELITPEEAESITMDAEDKDLWVRYLDRNAIGSPKTVVQKLQDQANEYGAHQLQILTNTYAFEDRVRSCELIMKEWKS